MPEGHRGANENAEFEPYASGVGSDISQRRATLDRAKSIPLGSGWAALFKSSGTSSPADAASAATGYCWPGHTEIEDTWYSDRMQDGLSYILGGKLIVSTLDKRKIWDSRDGKGYKYHAWTAGKQLGTKAISAYGAVASCKGTTKWWISYRTTGNWKWLVEGWECSPGQWGVWHVPTRVRRKDIAFWKYRYDRFDIKFHAESESGAFHRYYVLFFTAPDQ